MESVMYVHILPGFYSSLGPVGFWGEEVAKMGKKAETDFLHLFHIVEM